MKRYENGEYIELSQEEIAQIEKTKNEYIEESAYVEAENNSEGTIKETATGRAVILTDISNNTENLLIKAKGDASGAGRVVYVMGQNIWDEKCEYDSAGLYLYSKNYIHVIPETKYYLYCNSAVADWEENVGLFTEITYYNIAFQEISKECNVKRNSTITTPKGCYYMKFKVYEMYGEEYKNDICINLYDKRINGTYDAFKKEDAYDSNINGDIAVPKPEYSVITIFTEDDDVFLECEYSKNIAKVLAGKQDKQTLELISSAVITEEVSTISVTTDMHGNAFELEELYAWVKIPNPNSINPYIYFTAGTGCYISFGSLGTNNSTLIASWKRENLCAKVEHYQYYNIFKTAKNIEVTDDISVNQFRMSVFSDTVFPVGTEIKVWGRKVQE